jgi:hypothetical protein
VTKTVTYTVTPRLLTGIVTRPERINSKGAITVGCRLLVATLKSCRPSVLRGTTRVGRKTRRVAKTGTKLVNISVALKRSIRRVIARSVPGVPVTIGFLGTSFTLPGNMTDSRPTRVVARSVVARPKFNAFQRGNAQTTARGTTYLTKVANQVKVAKRVTCVARPDRGAGASLARKRAAAACLIMRQAGLTAKFKSIGRRSPPSRRLTVTIVR